MPALLGPKTSVIGRSGTSFGLLPNDLKFAMEKERGIIEGKWSAGSLFHLVRQLLRMALAPLGGQAAVEGAVEERLEEGFEGGGGGVSFDHGGFLIPSCGMPVVRDLEYLGSDAQADLL